MMRISEVIIDPNTVYVNKEFRLKIKIFSEYLLKEKFVTEDNKEIITEKGENIVTEWGIIDE
jgi:hypothetical protein